MVLEHHMVGVERLVVVEVKDVRVRPHLPRRLPMVGLRRLLRQDGLQGQRGAVADPVTVTEVAVVPLVLEDSEHHY